MKYILVTILFGIIFSLTGCVNSESGSPSGGVFKSVDQGRTFEAKNVVGEDKTLSRSNVFAIAIDPIDSNTLYAGTQKDDIFVSYDGAESWKPLSSKLSNISNILINPFDTKIIYASGLYKNRGSVIKSMDGGDTWERIYVEPKDGTNITAMTLTSIDGEIYIGTSGGTIAYTKNSGKIWKNLYNAQKKINDLLIDNGDINTLYALVDGKDIFRSRDGGVTFESIESLEREKDVQNTYNGTIYSMAVSPHITGVLVIGTDNGIFRSDDYGQSWNPVDVIASTIGIPIHAIKINPHNVNQLVYAAAKAVYTSVGDGWAITDTTSNRLVDVIAHDPTNAKNIYLGFKKIQ